MAPMTRSNNALIPRAEGAPRAQGYREASWQFVGSETRSDGDQSEEPASSHDGGGDGSDDDRPRPLISPDDHEDILHPLRETANRVGFQVEKFAEVLDSYNPQRATAQDERHDMMIDLLEMYHNIASDTVADLQERHASERQTKDGFHQTKKSRDLSVTSNEDDMDIEDEKPVNTHSPQRTTVEDLERWEQEAQTWDLLRRLVELRHPLPGSNRKRASSERSPIHRYSTEKELWNDFLEKDELALERKTVLQWLKDTAQDSGEDIDVLVQDLQQNADRGDIIAHGWLHTKSAIKGQKRLHAFSQPLDPSSPEVQNTAFDSSRGEPLVTQLDPDATTRQKRKLEAQDEYFERAIWLGCYEMLRRGRSPTAIKDWCQERTEVWRAVSMLGFPDERFENDDDFGTPESTALWRRMCFSLAHKGGNDDYERAVYGILSGDITSVEPVCSSWNDFMFIHYNALLRTQFDIYTQEIRFSRSPSVNLSNQGAFDAVQFHGDARNAGRKLIENLKTHARTANETMEPLKMLQGVLIANDFSNFIYQQGLALSKFANAKSVSTLIPPNQRQPENEESTQYIPLEDHDSLRVLTHILLIYMGLGLDLGGIYHETEVENVIVAYITFLRLAGKEELIPLYCSQLSGKRKYAILCRSLIDIVDPSQRETQIKLMRELGLDVQEFVKLQSRFLLNDHRDSIAGYPALGNFKLFITDCPRGSQRLVKRDFFGDDPDQIDRVDLLLIRSLEWYLLVDGMWSETFTVGTMLYLRFFKHMHLNAARRLASQVPSGLIASGKTYAILGASLDFTSLENEEDADLTEVLDGPEASDRKRLLKKHLVTEARSFRELETLTECLDNIETVTSMLALLDEDSNAGWQKSWRSALAKAYHPTRLSVKPLLKGWLLTSLNEGAAAEFRRVREAYLPETILAFINISRKTGNALTREFLMDCMELGALIAEEDSDLLDLFMKTERMEEVVEELAVSSKTLLLATSAARQNQSSNSKKLRMKGWTHELWNVKL